MSRPAVLFVDLDGTLILDNSFHVFLRELWRSGGVRGRLRLLRLGFRRLLQPGYDRVSMKRDVLREHMSGNPETRRKIALETATRSLHSRSAGVARILDDARARGDRWVLATAAPHLYATVIAESVGADDCIATSEPGEASWAECMGDQKALACSAWLAARGCKDAEITVVTDHEDDLPLMRLAHRVVIQASPDQFQSIAEELVEGQHLDLVDTVSSQPGGGIWLWIDGRAYGPNDPWEVKTILSKHRYALMFTEPGVWSRVRPGSDLSGARTRNDCPELPTTRERLTVHIQRKIVRDGLQIFH